MHAAIMKYGVDVFDIHVLQECSSYEELNVAERKWIRKLNSVAPYGYNLSWGGEKATGYIHTSETIRLIAAANRGQKRTAKQRERMSRVAQARKLTDRGRMKLSASRRGNTNRRPPKQVDQYNLNGEFITSFQSLTAANMSFSNPPGLRNISAVCRKKKSTCAGFIWRFKDDNVTDDELMIVSGNVHRLQRIKPVRQFTVNGQYITSFPSIKDASHKTGISASCITKCCHGKFKKTHGYVFMFDKNIITSLHGVKSGNI